MDRKSEGKLAVFIGLSILLVIAILSLLVIVKAQASNASCGTTVSVINAPEQGSQDKNLDPVLIAQTINTNVYLVTDKSLLYIKHCYIAESRWNYGVSIWCAP